MGIVLSPGEREQTAFHESGHALLGMLTPGADPVRKISIIPRGQALGVTYQAPEADRYGYSETYLRGRITGALGGRAADEVIYGDVTTGAENDMEHTSSIARQMVGRRGMSPAIGPVSVLPSSGQASATGADGVAPAARELVDTETRRIVGGMLPAGRGDPARQPGPAGPAGTHPPGPAKPWTKTRRTRRPASPATTSRHLPGQPLASAATRPPRPPAQRLRAAIQLIHPGGHRHPRHPGRPCHQRDAPISQRPGTGTRPPLQ